MRKITHVATLALALTVAACGGKDAEGTDTSAALANGATTTTDSATAMAPSGGMGAGTLADASTGAQLDSVATAARSGLTSLAPAVAVPLLQSLEDKLDASNDPELTDIAKDLEKLREELQDDTPTGSDIANILERLGPKVTKAAPKGGAASGTLTAIGAELTKAAAALKKS